MANSSEGATAARRRNVEALRAELPAVRKASAEQLRTPEMKALLARAEALRDEYPVSRAEQPELEAELDDFFVGLENLLDALRTHGSAEAASSTA